MKEKEYLDEIRASKGLPRAVLSDITVRKAEKKVTFHLVTDVIYSDADRSHALNITQKYLPEGFSPDVYITKLVPDEQKVREKIVKLIADYSPMVAAFIRPEDVQVEVDGRATRFCLDVNGEDLKLLRVKEILDGVTAELNRSFCGTFTGAVREVENDIRKDMEEERKAAALRETEEEEEILPDRYFDVCNYEAIDGSDTKPKTAKYIADCNGESDHLTICGEIVTVQERQTAKGKPFFVFNISDGSGRMRVTYFTKQTTMEKIRTLKAGDRIVCEGALELFNGNVSYHAKRINYGSMPEGFVPEERPQKQAPAAYHTVFPEPFEDYAQSSFFETEALPPDLTEHDFVVFDLETTGLNNTETGGTMDSIIEIGAVKLKNGIISEKFSTFVAYDKKLSQEIVKLTGITDDMLEGAPAIDKVIPDFYKFCEGCYLVGHNVMFDYRFVQYYAKKERFSFEQKRFDTMTLGQELLLLSNYKLNTLADYYGITFNHHRAFDDALTTAKIFIQLIKKRKILPVL